MAVKSCYHCGAPVPDGVAHDCWTTTEAALIRDLSEDLRDAWERLRDTAAGFGDQRIYASHRSIMFSRQACYFFVRPQARRLEICIFLGRTLAAPQVRRTVPVSRVKVGHIVHVRHRDEVEAPLTDWLHEAYAVSDSLRVHAGARPGPEGGKTPARAGRRVRGPEAAGRKTPSVEVRSRRPAGAKPPARKTTVRRRAGRKR